MTNLVAWTPDDSKRIASAVKVLERGALEHPFHRARWPISGEDGKDGEELHLFTSAETTIVGGPPKAFSGGVNGGISPQIAMYLVPRGLHDLTPTEFIDFTTTYQVNCGQIGTLVFPNFGNSFGALPPYSVWAIKRRADQHLHSGFDGESEYFAVAGGLSMFRGTVESILSGNKLTVTPTFPAGTPNDITCTSLFDESLVVDQQVAVSMIGVYPYVTNANCPPVV